MRAGCSDSAERTARQGFEAIAVPDIAVVVDINFRASYDNPYQAYSPRGCIPALLLTEALARRPQILLGLFASYAQVAKPESVREVTKFQVSPTDFVGTLAGTDAMNLQSDETLWMRLVALLVCQVRDLCAIDPGLNLVSLG